MTPKKVYLAGPITGLTFGEASDWREEVKRKLAMPVPTKTGRGIRPSGIEGYSPMRAKDYLTARGVLSGNPRAYDDQVLSSAKGILTRDRWDVMTCDLVFVNLLGTVGEGARISVGTVMEIAYADAFRKPCVVAMEEDNIHHHAMLDMSVGWIVPDLDFAVDITRAILLPDGVTVPEAVGR